MEERNYSVLNLPSVTSPDLYTTPCSSLSCTFCYHILLTCNHCRPISRCSGSHRQQCVLGLEVYCKHKKILQRKSRLWEVLWENEFVLSCAGEMDITAVWSKVRSRSLPRAGTLKLFSSTKAVLCPLSALSSFVQESLLCASFQEPAKLFRALAWGLVRWKHTRSLIVKQCYWSWISFNTDNLLPSTIFNEYCLNFNICNQQKWNKEFLIFLPAEHRFLWRPSCTSCKEHLKFLLTLESRGSWSIKDFAQESSLGVQSLPFLSAWGISASWQEDACATVRALHPEGCASVRVKTIIVWDAQLNRAAFLLAGWAT